MTEHKADELENIVSEAGAKRSQLEAIDMAASLMLFSFQPYGIRAYSCPASFLSKLYVTVLPLARFEMIIT